jgi:hypothetical protein
MISRDPARNLPPSGGWSGYYLYSLEPGKHRMKMSLAFSVDGGISGDGIDDIAPFTIRGFLDTETNAAGWTKAYIGMHSVEYRGLYDLRSICGNWTLDGYSGGFWIWPDGIAEGERLEVELPVEQLVTAEVD